MEFHLKAGILRFHISLSSCSPNFDAELETREREWRERARNRNCQMWFRYLTSEIKMLAGQRRPILVTLFSIIFLTNHDNVYSAFAVGRQWFIFNYSLIVIPREQNKSDGEVHLDGVSSRAESTSYKQLEIRQTWVWNYGFFDVDRSTRGSRGSRCSLARGQKVYPRILFCKKKTENPWTFAFNHLQFQSFAIFDKPRSSITRDFQ